MPILTEAYRDDILICYTNYYRANYLGIYANQDDMLITVNDLDHKKLGYKRSKLVIYWLYKRFAMVRKNPQETHHANKNSCSERVGA